MPPNRQQRSIENPRARNAEALHRCTHFAMKKERVAGAGVVTGCAASTGNAVRKGSMLFTYEA
jgi:hypothetical protein